MIYSVQYMRAIAALMIVIHHAAWKGEQYSSDPLSWFNVGGIGVDLFFIISGYIMCYTVDRNRTDFLSFIKARFFRIIPLYWVLTTLALGVYIFFPDKINSSGGSTNLIASYTLFPVEGKFLINNGWTLSYELLFYFIFSTCLAFKTLYKYLIPCFIIFLLVVSGLLIGEGHYLIDFLTSYYLLEFMLGIFAFYISKKTNKNLPLGGFLISCSVTAVILVNINNLGFERVIQYGVPAFFFFLGMLFMEPYFNKNKSKFFSSLLKALGDSSYSLYLFHPFSLVVFSIVLSRLGLADYGIVFVVGLVLMSLISGYVCYLLLEKPLVKLMKTNKPLH